MAYDVSSLPLNSLIGPLARAEDLLARLDERVHKSPVRDGFVERCHFADAASALWLDGELVHAEDLVLHDAHMNIRTPTHELTRAHAVLRARRRIFGHKADWALSRVGILALRGREGQGGDGASAARAGSGADAATAADLPEDDAGDSGLADETEQTDALAQEMAEIDAVLARSSRLLAGEKFAPRAADGAEVDTAGQGANAREALPDSLGPLIRDLDWNEEQRLADWLAVVDKLRGETMPAVLAATIAWEAWQDIEPLQHQHWLGPLLVAALLRETGKVVSHLLCLNAGLRTVPRDRRKSPVRITRLLAVLDGFAETASAGLKELDRLALAKTQMERRLRNRRKTSTLPALIELVLARPAVSAGLIAAELKISQRAALGLVAELGIREVTGRGRYRAWGIL
ncbi:RHE_PE00001 family protein [Mesorhizobium sp. f-mel]